MNLDWLHYMPPLSSNHMPNGQISNDVLWSSPFFAGFSSIGHFRVVEANNAKLYPITQISNGDHQPQEEKRSTVASKDESNSVLL